MSGSLEHRFLVVAASIVLVALGLRFYRIGAQELWLDEAFSFHIATRADWLAAARADNTPPLYYLLLRLWLLVFGASEAAVRSLSAAAAAGAVAVSIWLGRRMFGREAGLWSGLALAVSPIAVYYAQEARAYALLTLILILATGRIWIAVETNRWRDWAVAAALYTHYLAALSLVAALLLPAVDGRRDRFRRAAACALSAGLLFLPWLVLGLADTGTRRGGIAWIRAIWEQTPPELAPLRSLEIFAFGSHAGLVPLWLKQFATIDYPPLLRVIGLLALALAAFLLWQLRSQPPRERRAIAWLALLVGLPLVLLWTVSWVRPLYAAGRYDLIAYPAFPLLLGAALAHSRAARPQLLAALGLGLALPMLAKLGLYYDARLERQSAATAEALGRAVRPGDVVVFTGVRGLPAFYYLDRAGFRWREGTLVREGSDSRIYCRMFPRESELTPAATDRSRLTLPPAVVSAEVDDYQSHAGPGGTLWVAFESGMIAEGRLRVPENDAPLVRELETRGWKRRLDGPEAALLIVPFIRE